MIDDLLSSNLRGKRQEIFVSHKVDWLEIHFINGEYYLVKPEQLREALDKWLKEYESNKKENEQ